MNYTEKDFNSLYNTLKKTVLQQTSFDLDTDESYKKSLNSCVQSVIKKNANATNQYINSLLLHTVSNKFVEKINKSKKSRSNLQKLPNRPLNSDPRNNSGVFPRSNNSNDLSGNLRQPNIFDNPNKKPVSNRCNFDDVTNQTSKSDIPEDETVEQKMTRLMEERGMGMNNMNNGMRSPNLNNPDNGPDLKKLIKKSEEKLDFGNASDNDFFKNLYGNQSGLQVSSQNPININSSNNNNNKNFLPERSTKLGQFNDQSNADKLPDYNLSSPSPEIVEKNNLPKITNEIKTQGTELFQNTSFHNQRELGKLVYLDTGNIGADGEIVNVKVNLVEPVVVDGACDVFIEYLGLHGLKSGTSGTHIENINLFGLKIDELPVQVGTTSPELLNYYIFPNDTFGKTDISADAETGVESPSVDATTFTVKLKSNYMTTVSSNSFNSFTISLKGLTYNAGDNYDYVKGAGAGSRLVIGLFFKKRN